MSGSLSIPVPVKDVRYNSLHQAVSQRTVVQLPEDHSHCSMIHVIVTHSADMTSLCVPNLMSIYEINNIFIIKQNKITTAAAATTTYKEPKQNNNKKTP